MSGAGDGRKADIGAFGGTHAPSAGGAPSPSAMPDDGGAEQLALDELLPAAIPGDSRKGPGRPKGAQNLRTNKVFAAAVSRYGDPLMATVAMGNMSPAALIVELRKIASDTGIKLGATVMDVVRFQEQCRAAAVPYGHGKRIASDDKGNDVLPVFVMGGASGSTTNVNVGSSLEDRIAAEQKAKQDQSVIDVTPNMSHGGKSHDQSSD